MSVLMALRQLAVVSRLPQSWTCPCTSQFSRTMCVFNRTSLTNCRSQTRKAVSISRTKEQCLYVGVKSDVSWQKITWQCGFHTTPQRNIPPVLWMVVKPLARVASMLTGRKLRNWWRTLPEDHRACWRSRLLKRRQWFYLIGGGILTFGLVHYVTHIDETPVTHRRRYLAFTKEQFLKLAEFQYNLEFENVRDQIVAPAYPVYHRVMGVVKKIVDSNQDLEFMRQQTWTILIIDSKEVNAFVLPTGQIFVFTELLNMTETDSQLAVVLSHEISHALLSHSVEQVSFAAVLDVFIIIFMAAIWAFIPSDGIALVTQWFYNKVIEIFLHLPYSRRLEEEADEVGLQLMAKACYDVRESSAFWQKLALRSQLAGESVGSSEYDAAPQWLSTHPDHESRAKKLDGMIPAAEALRLECHCSPLSTRDPRSAIARLRQSVVDENAAKANVSMLSRTASNVAITAPHDPVPVALPKS